MAAFEPLSSSLFLQEIV